MVLSPTLGSHNAKAALVRELNELIAAYQQRLENPTLGLEDRIKESFQLAGVLRSRYARDGRLADLDQAVQCYEAVLVSLPPGAILAPVSVNLANTLLTRYRAAGLMADLDRAVALLEEALAAAATRGQTGDETREGVVIRNNLAGILLERFHVVGTLKDLDDAIKHASTAISEAAVVPGASDIRYRALNNLASGMAARYRLTGSPADLDEAMATASSALEWAPQDAPERPGLLGNLALTLHDRFAVERDPGDLERAIDLFETAMSMPQSPLESADHAAHLGTCLFDRYAVTGSRGDLEAALQFCEMAVRDTPRLASARGGRLANLSTALRLHYVANHDADSLRAAIEVASQAVSACQPGALDLRLAENALASALRERYVLAGEADDLDRAIGLWERASRGAVPPDLARYLSNLATGLRDLHQLVGTRDPIDRAVEAGDRATEAGTGQADMSVFLNTLAGALQDRHALTGDDRDLDRSVALLEAAVESGAVRALDAPKCMNNLAVALRTRYARSGVLEDLNRAIELQQDAIAAPTADAVDLPGWRTNLAIALRDRFAALGDEADLDAAVDLSEKASRIVPSGSMHHPVVLNNLAAALRDRFALTNNMVDLTRAIDLYQAAIDATPVGSPNRARWWSNLARALVDRYALTGAAKDVDLAVEVLQLAAGEVRPHGLDRLRWLDSMANAVRERYVLGGDRADLDEAIRLYEEALTATPAGALERAGRLSNLAAVLWDQRQLTDRPEDLDRPLDLWEQALRCVPAAAVERPLHLNNLAVGLLIRWREGSGREADLHRAVGFLEAAVRTSPKYAIDSHRWLANLASALRARHRWQRDPVDLDVAIERYEAALAVAPTGAADRSLHLQNLAQARRERYELLGRREDLDLASEACWTSVAGLLDTNPRAAHSTALEWAAWFQTRKQLPDALRAYEFAMEAAERKFAGQQRLGHRVLEVGAMADTSVPAALAACLVAERATTAAKRRSQLGSAAALLDRGRAMILTERLQLARADLAGLDGRGLTDQRVRYEMIADRVWALEREIEMLSGAGPQPTVPPGDGGSVRGRLGSAQLLHQLQEARRELSQSIAAIRGIPDFAHFLATSNSETVRQAAAITPLAYLAAGQDQGFALVVDPDGGASVIHLPTLTRPALRQRLEMLEAAHPGRNANAEPWWAEIDDLTRWLWSAVMGPVVERRPFGSRLALVTGGLLGLLPLHAASYRAAQDDQPTYALDRLLLTYVPNARTLLDAAHIQESVRDERLLAIVEPQPVGVAPLPSAVAEVAAAAASFSDLPRVLNGKSATRKAFLRHLPSHSVLHLACHAFADPKNPLDSALILANDERVTVRELLALRLRGLRLAVLSACETALPGGNIPDEAINLATGVRQAGSAGAIGSLWKVDGMATMLLMARFYRYWQQEEYDPAEALRRAQLWLRDTSNQQLRDEHPEILALAGPNLSSDYRGFWETARGFARAYHWAAFIYVGHSPKPMHGTVGALQGD